MVIEYLRAHHSLHRFCIIDLDVHHANGTQEIYYTDPTVLNISFHQDGRTLYPGTGAIEKIGRDHGEGYTVNLPLPPKTGSTSYLHAFDVIIPPLVHQFNPELIIYQCGVDTHHDDPLADLQLTYQTYYHLATRVHKLAQDTCKKMVVCFGGGYHHMASVYAYYNIMCGLLQKKDIITEDELPDPNQTAVHQIVHKLQTILAPYWEF